MDASVAAPCSSNTAAKSGIVAPRCPVERVADVERERDLRRRRDRPSMTTAVAFSFATSAAAIRSLARIGATIGEREHEAEVPHPDGERRLAAGPALAAERRMREPGHREPKPEPAERERRERVAEPARGQQRQPDQPGREQGRPRADRERDRELPRERPREEGRGRDRAHDHRSLDRRVPEDVDDEQDAKEQRPDERAREEREGEVPRDRSPQRRAPALLEDRGDVGADRREQRRAGDRRLEDEDRPPVEEPG